MILTQCAICTAPTFREEYDPPAVCGDCFADGRKVPECREELADRGDYERQCRKEEPPENDDRYDDKDDQ